MAVGAPGYRNYGGVIIYTTEDSGATWQYYDVYVSPMGQPTDIGSAG